MTAGGMALRGGEVDDLAAGEQVERARPSSISYCSTSGSTWRTLAGELAQVGERDLDVEVAGVGEHGAVLHALEVLAAQHVARAGDGDEHVAALGGGERGQDLEALHPRLERAQRVDLADDDRRAGAAGAQRDAAPGPAVAEHDDGLAGEQHVRRAEDAVERGLAGAEAVVQRALGRRPR